jgi:hypothetical protein
LLHYDGIRYYSALVRDEDKRQQSQVARTLDLPRQFTLAARTVTGLAARLNLTRFINIFPKCVRVFIAEAWAVGAILRLSAACSARTPRGAIAIIHHSVVASSASRNAIVVVEHVEITHKFVSLHIYAGQNA